MGAGGLAQEIFHGPVLAGWPRCVLVRIFAVLSSRVCGKGSASGGSVRRVWFSRFFRPLFAFRPLSAGSGNCYTTVIAFACLPRDVGVGWVA